ncbi:hypothetical protein [Rhizobium sp. GR12]|uniref:hypothetical protein n=1 Tax=Rhizobium sp. GR12 TaxID=3053925 RepID=UPI002FBD713D
MQPATSLRFDVHLTRSATDALQRARNVILFCAMAISNIKYCDIRRLLKASCQRSVDEVRFAAKFRMQRFLRHTPLCE